MEKLSNTEAELEESLLKKLRVTLLQDVFEFQSSQGMSLTLCLKKMRKNINLKKVFIKVVNVVIGINSTKILIIKIFLLFFN